MQFTEVRLFLFCICFKMGEIVPCSSASRKVSGRSMGDTRRGIAGVVSKHTEEQLTSDKRRTIYQ